MRLEQKVNNSMHVYVEIILEAFCCCCCWLLLYSHHSSNRLVVQHIETTIRRK